MVFRLSGEFSHGVDQQSSLPSSPSPLYGQLQVEEQFYLLTSRSQSLFSRGTNLRRFLIGCAIAAPVLRSSLVLFAPHNTIAGSVLMPCRMDALALGGLVALGDRPFPRFAFPIAAAVLATILCLRGISAYDPFMRSIGYSAVDLTCACVLSSILRSRGSTQTAILRLRPLVYTGQIAYGLYLLHEPASWTARRLLGNIEAHSALSVPITFAASFLAAGLSWRFFESSSWPGRTAFKCENEVMSVYQDRKQALEQHEFRLGLERGRLAVTLDLLTDALVLVVPARRLLPERPPARQTRHGHSDHQQMRDRRQGTHHERHGRAQKTVRTRVKTDSFPSLSRSSYSLRAPESPPSRRAASAA